MTKTNNNVAYGWNGEPIYKHIYLEALAPIFSFMLSLFIIVTWLGLAGYCDTHYSVTAEVLSTENNSVLLVDGAGYEWEVMDRPDLHEGEFVRVRFFNNTTDFTREDDEILSVKVLDK